MKDSFLVNIKRIKEMNTYKIQIALWDQFQSVPECTCEGKGLLSS